MSQIMQGDCLELMKKIEDNSIDMIVTSPPYNKCAKQQNNNKQVTGKKAVKI